MYEIRRMCGFSFVRICKTSQIKTITRSSNKSHIKVPRDGQYVYLCRKRKTPEKSSPQFKRPDIAEGEKVLGSLRRRRVFNLVLFLGGAGLIFLIFQIFILTVLNDQPDRKHPKDILSSLNHVKIQQELADLNKHHFLKSNHSEDRKKSFDDIDSTECVSLECKQNKLAKKKSSAHTLEDQRAHRWSKEVKKDLQERKPLKLVDTKDLKRNKHEEVEEKDILLNNKPEEDGGQLELLSDNKGDLQIHVEEDALAIDPSHVPRGVYIRHAQYYIKDSTFTCLHSKEVIPISAINDDYCDCKDSSDEPGTNACPDSKFYCKYQLNGNFPKWLPGSQVNDGICDCCDGSDEWMNVKLPETVLLKDNKPHYGLYQGPCQDRCKEVHSQQQHLDYIREQGRLLKQKYVQGALGKPKPDTMYGKDGAFLMLSNECFTRTSDKYQYIVCPFQDVRQKDGNNEKRIGRNPNWVSQGGKDGYKLQMLNGESVQCPGMISRMALLVFECGLQNQVLSVHETEICEYTIHFSTPAAC